MKKNLILLSLFILIVQCLMGQKTDTVSNTNNKLLYETYMTKVKTNRTVGWVLFGVGTGLTIGGMASALSGGVIYSSTPNKGKDLFIAGVATSLSCIPFFIAGGSNRRKAKLALKGESVFIENKILTPYNYASLSLTLPLFGGKNKLGK